MVAGSSAAFDSQAAAYDRWYATPLGQLTDRVEKEALFGILPSVQGRLLLEVGCGTGNITLALARRGARVVGLDASRPMLAAARRREREAPGVAGWLQGRAESLPFPAHTFDGVLSALALDFMADRLGAVREMVRVLRPGGFLAVAVLNRHSLWTLKRRGRAWLKASLWRGVHFLTPGGLLQLIWAGGDWEAVHLKPAVYFPPWGGALAVRGYARLERLAQHLRLPGGAVVVAVARKKRVPFLSPGRRL
mgnify:CR=1 FL=1|uniref:Class I SAM-dependent methyltransferase n=1 Tax=Desulfobacca acetoxidans TaxID=60893 RepID=A0A7V4LDB0_9BACT